MFDTLRDLISSRHAAARAELLIAKAKHRTDRLVARADRSSVSRLAAAVEGVQAAFIMWIKGPSTPSSDVAVDIFIPHVMRGVAEGATAVADYLSLKADRKREAEVAKTDEQRKADELAKIVGMVYMSIGQDKTVSIVVDNSAVRGLALTLNDLFPLLTVTVEDTAEPGKSRLMVHATSDDSGEGEGGEGEGGDVH